MILDVHPKDQFSASGGTWGSELFMLPKWWGVDKITKNSASSKGRTEIQEADSAL